MSAVQLDTVLDRPLPQSPDAERAVLGSILINNNAFYRVIGLVDTEDEIVARYPMGRLGEPADTAAAAVFLCSDDASWITGVTLPLDGGENAARFRRHT